MAIYNNTLDDLVITTGRLYLHDLWSGTTTGAGSTTTLVDANNRVEDDDYFQNLNAQLYIRSGTYAGSTRRITDFANSTGTVTFAPALAGAPGSSVTYSIHARYSRAEIVNAINQAIESIAEDSLFFTNDSTSVTLDEDTYEYDIPASFMYIYRLVMADADGDFTNPEVPPDAYYVRPSSSPKLVFRKKSTEYDVSGWEFGGLWSPTDSRALLIEGLASPAKLAADTDACPIDPNYICAYAASLLHKSRVGISDGVDHLAQSRLWEEEAKKSRALVVATRLPANARRVRE